MFVKKEGFEPELELPARSRIYVDPDKFDCGMANSPMTSAMNVVDSFNSVGDETDPLGMWTGNPKKKNERPIQDADDL